MHRELAMHFFWVGGGGGEGGVTNKADKAARADNGNRASCRFWASKHSRSRPSRPRSIFVFRPCANTFLTAHAFKHILALWYRCDTTFVWITMTFNLLLLMSSQRQVSVQIPHLRYAQLWWSASLSNQFHLKRA